MPEAVNSPIRAALIAAGLLRPATADAPTPAEPIDAPTTLRIKGSRSFRWAELDDQRERSFSDR